MIGITEFYVRDWSFSDGVGKGAWSHLVIVCTTDPNRRTQFYLDGKPIGELPVSIALPRTWLGSTWGDKEFFVGCLEELKLYNQALTAEQVRELANQSPTLNPRIEVVGEGKPMPQDSGKDLGAAYGKTCSATFTIKNSGRGGSTTR